MERIPGPLWWAAIAAIGSLAEAKALRGHRHTHTLSHAVRAAFRTHTGAGKLVFGLAWTGFGIWFLDHILSDPEPCCDSDLRTLHFQELGRLE